MTGGAAAYLYDIDNKMTSATVGRVTTSLTYDPLGRLYSVTSASGTRRFLYAPGDSGLPEVLEEYDGSGGLVGLYAHGPGPDEPLIWEDPGIAYRSLHADERGSVIAAGDGAGGAYAINRYDEYGAPQGGSITGRFGYTGQVWLGEIGLQYSRARMYSPVLGRFMQTDPIGPADDANLYQYALNDPVNNVDPMGLATPRPAPCDPDKVGTCGDITITGKIVRTFCDKDAFNPLCGPRITSTGLPGFPRSGRGPGLVGVPFPLRKPRPAPPPTQPPPYNPNEHYCGGEGGAQYPSGSWNIACYNHDICYGTVGAIKSRCDAALRDQIAVMCSNVPQFCGMVSLVYWVAVNRFGDEFFNPTLWVPRR